MLNRQDRAPDSSQERGASQNSRREFVKTALALGASTGLDRLIAQPHSSASKSGVLFEGYAIPAAKRVQEATLAQPADGLFWMLFGEKNHMVGKYSKDH